jgi:hypothetical protein
LVVHLGFRRSVTCKLVIPGRSATVMLRLAIRERGALDDQGVSTVRNHAVTVIGLGKHEVAGGLATPYSFSKSNLRRRSVLAFSETVRIV